MPSDDPQKKPLTAVVGIGTSAGGLEACRQFLASLPKDTGMAFVLVQHLDPTHESMMAELLGKIAPIPVVEAKDKTRLKPNILYVMPPNVNLTLTDGTLAMEKRSSGEGRRMVIDQFFRSLAESQGQNAIAIVLSGSGTDGTPGLRAVKEHGGLAFAQNPTEAKFDGMPRSAISAGCADVVLPVGEIAAELQRLANHPYVSPSSETPPAEESEVLSRIFAMLRKSSGVDFSNYKRATLLRRIGRRMAVHRMEQVGEYIEFLQKNPQEVDALYQDILVKVTSFFRDPEVFDYLKSNVYPAMLQGHASDLPVRIWVPGCATGEEVYSIAISLLETIAERAVNTGVQIFATDISEQAIDRAREGCYLENISEDVTPGRLSRFFSKVEGGYQVSKTLRDMCVFARQNMTSDPPFSRLNMISCRNVLIYLEPTLQKLVLPLFHYALRPGGVLMLGSSEGIGKFNDLFALEDRHFKIYVKKAGPGRPHMDFATGYPAEKRPELAAHREENRLLADAHREADRVIFSKYSAAGVLINDLFEILQFRGDTTAFLEHGPGEASLNLLNLARDGLGMEVRTLVQEARVKRAAATRDRVLIHRAEKPMWVRIEVFPLNSSPPKETFFLVLFQESTGQESDLSEKASGKGGQKEGGKPAQVTHKAFAGRNLPPAKKGKAVAQGTIEQGEQVEQLRRELAAGKAHLQAIIEEHEATNEQLQSANEEILSSNEELQSINEELETAKEELQSTNEELTTVNEELQNRNVELGVLNNDLSNLLSSLNIPIVMLDNELHIRRFTPQAEKLLSLIPADIGRPISDIKPRINVPDLEKMIRDVIENVTPRELEVQDRQNHWWALRVRPYKTRDNKIDGAVLALLDIDVVKRSRMQLIQLIQRPMIILDEKLDIRALNDRFLARFGFLINETERKSVYGLSESFGALRKPLEALLAGTDAVGNFKMSLKNNGVEREIAISAEKLKVSPEQLAAGHILLVSFEG